MPFGKKLGALTVWANSFKKEDNQPDYKGLCDVDGKKMRVSLWINHDIGGVPIHMSGQISEYIEGDQDQGDPPPERPAKEATPYGGKNPPDDQPV